ncbi:hypothetical protein FE257_007722 [Aspergillus nanangensis]|uniref:Uncharacterized protein n=1 Tax=Aspergillus nanangensis TaxID=2582783 RepID=A0AAD4GYZ3_ASPNN|nr:hypothetical protein FE257_007722 [Aspergillus nanangensis]
MFSRLPPTSRLQAPSAHFLSMGFPASRRHFSSSKLRFNASQSPNAYKEGMGRYKLLASPFAKVFLGAIFTYQVIHWTWLKLEMDESKYEKNREVASLEKEAKELTAPKK